MLPKFLLTVVCLVLWLLTFSVGAFIDTNPLRASLSQDFKLGDFLLIVAAWIPTNLAILSILAGLSGALCHSLFQSIDQVGGQKRPLNQVLRVLGGGVAGLIFYLTIMAMAFLLMDQPFETTTKQQYFRISGVVSFMAFLAGFRPDLLRKVLEKLPGY